MKRRWIVLATLCVGGAHSKMAQAAPNYVVQSSTHSGSNPDPNFWRTESGSTPGGGSLSVNTHVGDTLRQVVEMAGTINAATSAPGRSGASGSDDSWAGNLTIWAWDPDDTDESPSDYTSSITYLHQGQMTASFAKTGTGIGQYGGSYAEGSWNTSSSCGFNYSSGMVSASAPYGSPSLSVGDEDIASVQRLANQRVRAWQRALEGLG